MSTAERAGSGGVPDAPAGAVLRDALTAHIDALAAAKRVWVGLSGGADSTALLLSLADLGCCADLRATHVNHGAQSEASAWEAHCAALCQRHNLALSVFQAQPSTQANRKEGFEVWARSVRYDHWRQLLEPGDLLVLGHHQADQQETIALRLLQGRLPLPMPVRRSLAGAIDSSSTQRASVLRPFLSVTPEACRAALEQRGVAWIEDPSNQSIKFLRNYVRLQILPRLANTEPNRVAPWLSAIERCGDLTGRLVQALNPGASSAHRVPKAGELLRLPAVALECPAAVQASFAALGYPTRSASITDALHRLHEGATGVAVRVVNTNTQLLLWRTDAGFLVWREPRLPPDTFEVPPKGEVEIALEHGALRVYGPPGFRFSLRGPAAGEKYFAAGRDRPVREALRAQGVPRWLRSSFPLVTGAEPSAERSACVIPRLQRIPRPPNRQDQARDQTPEGHKPAVAAWFKVRGAG